MRSLVILASICMLLYKADAGQLRCYECINEKCDTYFKMPCRPDFDHCLTASGFIPYKKNHLKSCAPMHMCDVSQLPLPENADVECCQGDLCNGAESFTLSLLLMFIPLLSSILFY